MVNADEDEKLKGVLAYILGPVTGIIFLLTEKQNGYIRFHAMQSTLVFGAVILFYAVLRIVPILGPIIAFMFSYLINLIVFILWLMLMWKAYNGEKYKLPYFGKLAEKQLEKLK